MLLPLLICASSIYTFFLLWALLQERLTTTPYTTHAHDGIGLVPGETETTTEYFSSPLLLNWTQAVASTVVAGCYLVVGTRGRRGESIGQRLGLAALLPSGAKRIEKGAVSATTTTSKSNGHPVSPSSPNAGAISPLLLRYTLISLLQSLSSQLGLHSLSHGISYPTLTLAKSCKLVPVLIMNVLLYRRKFPRYKYAVVGMVTAGISAFMLFGPQKKGKKGGRDSLVGVLLLVVNLILDGATNSTQDDVFHRWAVTGPQMMLVMNAISALLLGGSLVLPLPSYLGSTSGTGSGSSELTSALAFIHRHPSVLRDVLLYAGAGALGQVAIFETLQRFGSLTLVSITVTRKLFTMLLSLVVYSHRLTTAQWVGVGMVFVGLGVEAREKRREGSEKARKKQAGVGANGEAKANGRLKAS